MVRRGDNDIRAGIAAVTARLRTGRLKVRRGACPNLLTEARLYRYPTAAETRPARRKPGGRTQSRPWPLCVISFRALDCALHRPAAESEPRPSQ